MIKNTTLIKDVIKKMGGTIEEVLPERGCFYFSLGGKRILITRKFAISRSPISSGRVAKFKDLTYLLLKEHDLPTPKTVTFYRRFFEINKARKALQSLQYPVIVKDAQGSNSKGVFPNIATPEEALTLVQKEILNYSKILVQDMVFGKEYRVLVLGDRVIGALEMIPPRITGDGELTVSELISKKQEVTDKKTLIDESLDTILMEQGVTLGSVLPKGAVVNIKKNSALAEGGETMDVTELVHKDIEKMCVAASEVMGKYLVGIDVMCEDISKNPKQQSFSILEINGKPDLYIHYKPTHGQTKNVIEDIVKFVIDIA